MVLVDNGYIALKKFTLKELKEKGMKNKIKKHTNKISLTSKEQARICLECPLDVEKCNMGRCERFILETKKIKEKKRKWVEKKLQKNILTY